jgi:hypothetical protein
MFRLVELVKQSKRTILVQVLCIPNFRLVLIFQRLISSFLINNAVRQFSLVPKLGILLFFVVQDQNKGNVVFVL